MLDPRHPTDELIARLVAGEEALSEAAADAIVRRMSSAPFSRQMMRVPTRERGLVHQGIVLGRLADSLDYHLVKRVRVERQWSASTTVAEYLAHLYRAMNHRSARLLVYERRGTIHASVIAPTAAVVPRSRLGASWLPHMLVVYSASNGAILTGYMFSSLETLNLSENIVWLR